MVAYDLGAATRERWKAYAPRLLEELEADHFRDPLSRGPLLSTILSPMSRLFELRPSILRVLTPWLLESVASARRPEDVAMVALAEVPRSWAEARRPLAFHFSSYPFRGENERDALQIAFERFERVARGPGYDRQPLVTPFDLGVKAPGDHRAWLKFLRWSIGRDKIPKKRPRLEPLNTPLDAPVPKTVQVLHRDRDTLDVLVGRAGYDEAANELRKLFGCIHDLLRSITPSDQDVNLRPRPGLPARCRRLVVLYEKTSRPWKTTKEIADLVSARHGTVRSDLTLARREVSAELGRNGLRSLTRVLEILTKFRGFRTADDTVRNYDSYPPNWWSQLMLPVEYPREPKMVSTPLTIEPGTLFSERQTPWRVYIYVGTIPINGKRYHRLIEAELQTPHIVDNSVLMRRYSFSNPARSAE